MKEFNVVIPARLDSSRLPRKVLLDICGSPMIRHVWDRAMASGAASVVVATDSDEVAEVANGFGAAVAMTGKDCASGTDRVAEVSHQRGWAADSVVVNVQGDAPLIDPDSIKQVADLLLRAPEASMSTLCVPLTNEEEYLDPNVVKVTFNNDGRALYFSRASIPARGHATESSWSGWRHLGLYGYRVRALQEISAAPTCELEETERLEQLRALWLGHEIRIAVDEHPAAPDVDTEADLQVVAALIQERNSN
ncbi:MAG: 3-deoxy-manno-octulosonate cytidylyltransferase [Gammaproteobacteria bacterium]